ncbi:hypothetical protein RvY_01760 [Ramazzottius varieornatus]|uniref:Tudor domain-containing protein n=1 Tax=Ramazzottius varieornatus TaxID=947166 RepID=A0A1D1UI97_RAMVA|nr:hypothetical protein RvY_01760 [Ramazzottius varieornatus]
MAHRNSTDRDFSRTDFKIGEGVWVRAQDGRWHQGAIVMKRETPNVPDAQHKELATEYLVIFQNDAARSAFRGKEVVDASHLMPIADHSASARASEENRLLDAKPI